GLRTVVRSWGPDRRPSVGDDIYLGLVPREEDASAEMADPEFLALYEAALPRPYRRPWRPALQLGAALLTCIVAGRLLARLGASRLAPWTALGGGWVVATALHSLLGDWLVGSLPWQPWDELGNARLGLLVSWPGFAR